ncbi:C6 transcription factor RegA [Naviculisporaceae sp. PSN 640]
MASPIGNLIHPPDPSGSDSLPHSYYPHPPQSLPLPGSPHHSHGSHHPSPTSHPTSHPNNPTSRISGGISLAPLNTTGSALASSVPAPSPAHNAAAAPGLVSRSRSTAPPTPQSAGSAASALSNAIPPTGHDTNKSLYQCADCLRRYSRPEHLQRHIATHTLGKRFACDICSKAFSRADLLKRHRANHQDDNGTKRRRITSSPSAGRVAHACQACAKARVKCEELKPQTDLFCIRCSRCKNRGIACEFASSEDAAMHLLHLSSNARRSSHPPESVRESSYPPPPPAPATSSTDKQFPPATQAVHDHISPYPSHQLHQQAITQTPGSSRKPAPNEEKETQLPTPETLMDQPNPGMMDHSNPEAFQPPYPGSAMVDGAPLPFTDFLRDVLYDQSLPNPDRLAEAQGLAVLDFCDNAQLDLKDLDFSLMDQWNPQGGFSVSGPAAPSSHPVLANSVEIEAMRTKLVKIWTDSPWRWSPEKTDTFFKEQTNLQVPGTGIDETGGTSVDRVIAQKLLPAGRDKVLGIVLSTCRDNSTMTRIASSFPSTEMMDSWIHIFLASHLCTVSAWIHYGSFSLNTRWPEWLAMAAAAGAFLAPIPALRRFGLALQEVVRKTIIDRFEEANTKIADIVPVQTLIMVQDVGLWSGNRRKMEIAECHLQVPIAMMRYRGRFQRSSYTSVVIDPSDEGKVLEEKWRRWYELESWKRLAFHAYLRDAQVSMTQFCNPSMSYAELTLPLPCSKELWFSRTAEEFKIRYLEVTAATSADGRIQAPSLCDLLRDVNLLAANHHLVDVQYAISIYLHGFWSLIWEFRQLNSVYRPTTQLHHAGSASGFVPGIAPGIQNQNLLLNSRHQELCKMLQTFQLITHDWHEMLSAQESIVLHLLLMNLHVSLDDLQLFSGKEGEEQARSVYPILQRWADSYEARQALWHAGQILRQGKLFPPGHLKDFYAVAVHHAALCIWTHGVVVKASGPGRGIHQQQHHQAQEPVVYLDGEDSPLVHRYISFGQGRPAIRGPMTLVAGSTMMQHHQQQAGVLESLVEDSQACMEITQEILRENFARHGASGSGGGGSVLPPISENIVQLLKQLGNAASAVGLG